MTQQDVRLARRRYLGVIASASSIGVVGCIGANPAADANESSGEEPGSQEDAPNGTEPDDSEADDSEADDSDTDEESADQSDGETADRPANSSAFYDLANTGSNDDTAGLPSDPSVRWEYEFQLASRQPVVADGRAFVTLRGWRRGEPNAFAVDLETGELLWSNDLPRSAEGPPALVNDVLYYYMSSGTYDENSGRIFGLDTASGEKLWETGTEEPHSPLAADEHRIYAPGDARLEVLDRESGEGLWRFTEGRGPATTPAVDDDTVYVVTFPDEEVEEKLTALDAASGSVRWQIDVPFETASSPPVVGEEAIFMTHDDDGTVAIDPATGDLLWETAETAVEHGRPPAVSDGRLYLTGGRRIWAFDGSTGEIEWKQRCECQTTSAPAVVDGVVYLGTDAGVRAYGAAEGTHRWTTELATPVDRQPVVVDGTVLVPTHELPSGQPRTVYALE